MKRVLTIAGSDSGGGAGIQADLKVITTLGGYGMSVLTALTAQNTTGVQGIHEVPPSFVAQQIDSVLSDIGADAIKTGMLANQEIIEAVARKIRQYRVRRVVVDPVMVAKSGDLLLREDAREALIRRLLPLATVVTPNLMEASVLTGFRVRSMREMKRAARRIHEMGAKHVVVKGGHLKGLATDLLYDGSKFLELQSPRVDTRNTHGTGCTYASAIATYLAMGEPVPEAVERAKSFITLAIRANLPLGDGAGPTNPFIHALREMERYRVIQALKEALALLRGRSAGYLVPEVSSNLGYALPYAQEAREVAAFPGRIVRWKGSMMSLGDPEFGASRHIAHVILTVMRFAPEFRSAMNIRYSRENVHQMRKRGFAVGHFDRRREPRSVKQREGSSLEWGVAEVLGQSPRIPDFIYDEGGMGKEPMIRVLGRTPLEVVRKTLQGFGKKP